MTARYANPRADLEGERRVRVAFEVENRSREPWRRDEGFAFGFHIFDPVTDTLVVDGARTRLSGDVESGQSSACQVTIDLPPEPGRYRVFVSPMRENVAWYYSRGWPFLVLDALVKDGRAEVKAVRVATRRTLAGERLLRAFGRLFTLPFQSIYAHRRLIQSMVRRDILSRYSGSFMGAFWTVLSPLMLMVTYFFVFGIVLEARLGKDASRTGFALYFLAGMLPWLAFSEALGRAPMALWEHRNFVKKLVFPVETLPVNLTAAGVVTECIAAVLFLIALIAIRGSLPWTALWLPALLVPQVLFTLGLCWFVSALSVFLRDLAQVMGFLLTLLFFLTPICYPETSLPPGIAPWLTKNPMYVLVKAYRLVLLDAQPPSWAALGGLYALGFAVFLIGYAWFYKLKRSFADVM